MIPAKKYNALVSIALGDLQFDFGRARTGAPFGAGPV